MDIKNIKMYARNYSSFSSKDFHDDVSIQKWNYDLNNPTELFKVGRGQEKSYGTDGGVGGGKQSKNAEKFHGNFFSCTKNEQKMSRMNEMNKTKKVLYTVLSYFYHPRHSLVCHIKFPHCNTNGNDL